MLKASKNLRCTAQAQLLLQFGASVIRDMGAAVSGCVINAIVMMASLMEMSAYFVASGSANLRLITDSKPAREVIALAHSGIKGR